MPQSKNYTRQFLPLATLFVITLLAAGLRCYQLGEGLWVDELHTSWVVADGVEQIAWRARIGNYSGCYFYLVWAVTQLVGTSEVTLRLPSLFAGVLLVPAVYFAVSNWTASRGAGLLAAALTAIERDLLLFAGEARPYALVQLLGLLHVMLFWRLLQDARLFLRVLYIASAALLFYLHYTAILLVAAEFVCYLLVWGWRREKLAYRPLRFILDIGILGLCCLPSLWHLSEIAARRKNWACFISQIPSARIIRWDLYLASPLASLTAIAVAARLMGRKVFAKLPDSKVWLLVFSWLFVPIAIVWFLTVTDLARMYMLRYVAVAAPAALVFVGFCFALCKDKMTRVVFTLAILSVAITSNGLLSQVLQDGSLIGERNEDWRGAVAWVSESKAWSQLPVLVHSGMIEVDETVYEDPALRQYGLLPVSGIYRLDDQSRLLIPLPTIGKVCLDEKDLAAIHEAGGTWVIMRAGEIPRSLLNVLPASSSLVIHREFGTIRVVRIETAGSSLDR